MTFLSSLDRKDRTLLLVCVSLGVLLAIAAGILAPKGNDNDDPLPSSYLTGRHGTRAAYEALERADYSIERWERPLDELAATAGPDTVVILAEPGAHEISDLQALRKIVERGGRVLVTGMIGGFIAPGSASTPPNDFTFAPCKLTPEGIDPLAGTGEVWMATHASWKTNNPAHRTQYTCAGSPAVVEYDWGKGHVVWWAGSTPLENGFITRAQNFDLLLNSLGPREGHHFYWDESMHGQIRSTWSYAAGPALWMLRIGLLLIAIIIVFSFSRRSGPLRDLPAPARATPMEFLHALGSVYGKAGASSTAISVAWERFRRQMLRLCGQRVSAINADELAAILRRRFPNADASLEADLTECQEATWSENVPSQQALRIVQILDKHRSELLAAAKLGNPTDIHSKSQERSS